MPIVAKREAAKRDLIEHYVYIGERAGVAVAERFLAAAERTFRGLSRMPKMGAPGKIGMGRFADVRLWRVDRFPKYLIAYRPIDDGVQIERVIHTARDYRRVLR